MNAAPSRARSVDMQVDLSRRWRDLVPRRNRRHAHGAQTRLLRVLQEGEFTAVGGRSALSANARIVAANASGFENARARRRLSEDLYYRLNVVPVRLPPLRERVEDIPELVRHFLRFVEYGWKFAEDTRSRGY